MPFRVTDSIFQQDTGRKMHEQDVDFVLQRLRAFGLIPNNTTDHTRYISENLTYMVVWNAKLPRPFDPWFMVFQTWHETGGYTATYYTRDGNMAGIGIWQGGIPSPWEGKLNPEDAAKVYLLELMAHTYTEAEYDAFMTSDVGLAFAPAARKDASHLTKLWNLRHSVSWPTVRTIAQLNDKVGQWDNVWAADSQYPEKIVNLANTVAPNLPDTKGTAMAVNIGNRPLRIAIGAGHRNTSGGNQWEAAMTAKCTNEIVKLARASKGFEIRSYTPEDGLGYFNGPLDANARVVVGWHNAGWSADILHEVHFEGTAPSIRGAFVIYPDSAGLIGRNAGNVDLDVKSEAGKMAEILAKEFGGVTRYGIPGRGMSERETGVGGQGFRLGVFGAWAEPYFNNNSFQFLTEAAAYTNQQDLAIMQRPEFPKLHAIGVLKAYVHLAKARGNWSYPYEIAGVTAPVPGPNPVPSGPKGLDGLPFPAGVDNGLLSMWFGKVRPFGSGAVSRAWYVRSKAEGVYPPLLHAFNDTETGRQYYLFGSGWLLWRPNKTAAFRWMD
jgi:hypothetical protein